MLHDLLPQCCNKFIPCILRETIATRMRNSNLSDSKAVFTSYAVLLNSDFFWSDWICTSGRFTFIITKWLLCGCVSPLMRPTCAHGYVSAHASWVKAHHICAPTHSFQTMDAILATTKKNMLRILLWRMASSYYTVLCYIHWGPQKGRMPETLL